MRFPPIEEFVGGQITTTPVMSYIALARQQGSTVCFAVELTFASEPSDFLSFLARRSISSLSDLTSLFPSDNGSCAKIRLLRVRPALATLFGSPWAAITS